MGVKGLDRQYLNILGLFRVSTLFIHTLTTGFSHLTSRKMHHHGADCCDDDNLMAQVNQQLACELLQSHASTLTACLAS
jgi:hypothetical protein